MTREVGLWIDHRKAVVVIVTEKAEETKVMESGMEKHTRFSGRRAGGDAAEDTRDRQFGNRLSEFYDKVIDTIGDAGAIQIFGPGEAKGELATRLERKGLKGRIVTVESMDKMTDRQIAAKVREHFMT